MRHLQQTLRYTDRSDEIAAITHILDLMREKDFDVAARLLVIYLDALQDAQKPKLEDYDPRAELAALAERLR
jgi:hypothetical protein